MTDSISLKINHAISLDSKWKTTCKLWIKELNKSLTQFQKFAVTRGMSVTEDYFKPLFSESTPYIIETFCDFTAQLRGMAASIGKPIVYLTPEDYNQHDASSHYIEIIAHVRHAYSAMAMGLLNLKTLPTRN